MPLKSPHSAKSIRSLFGSCTATVPFFDSTTVGFAAGAGAISTGGGAAIPIGGTNSDGNGGGIGAPQVARGGGGADDGTSHASNSAGQRPITSANGNGAACCSAAISGGGGGRLVGGRLVGVGATHAPRAPQVARSVVATSGAGARPAPPARGGGCSLVAALAAAYPVGRPRVRYEPAEAARSRGGSGLHCGGGCFGGGGFRAARRDQRHRGAQRARQQPVPFARDRIDRAQPAAAAVASRRRPAELSGGSGRGRAGADCGPAVRRVAAACFAWSSTSRRLSDSRSRRSSSVSSSCAPCCSGAVAGPRCCRSLFLSASVYCRSRSSHGAHTAPKSS